MAIFNPILRGFNPDPSICRVGDDYFIATSTFEWFPGVQIHHSRNLADWTLASRPLTRATQLDMRGNPDSCGVWAPALSYQDEQFWLIYTNVRRFDGNYKDAFNYLVTAPAIDGPWSDPVYLNASGFDPSLFHDDDGRKWLVNMRWDHRATREGGDPPADFFEGIVMQEYDHSQQRLVGPVHRIFGRSPLGLTEAPHLFKRNGWYYLITAEGGTGYEHAVTYARSRTLTGPYELHPDTHVLTTTNAPDSPLQRVGHGQSCAGPDDDTMLHTFLCSRPMAGRKSPMGRETGLTTVHWDDDGWPRQPGGPVPPHSFEGPNPTDLSKDETYEFKSGALPAPFQWLRSPEPDVLFSTDQRADWLRLFGRESIGSWFEQSLVALRQTEYRCGIDVTVDATPNHFQQQAGIVAYYNRHKFWYLYLTRNEDGVRRLSIQGSPGDWPDGGLEFPIGLGVQSPDGVVELGLDIDHAALQFRYRAAGETDWTAVGPVLDASVLSDEGGRGEHGSFTGNFLGMAAQDVSGQSWHADFRDFRYWCQTDF